MFNVIAKTSSVLWIANLHWDFGDGSTLDVPFSGQSQISEIRAHQYGDQSNHIITVTATDNTGNIGSVCVTLKPDFSITVSPSTQTVKQGDNAAYNVNVGSVCGSLTHVVLTVSSPSPTGVTWSFNPESGNTPFGSVLTIQTGTTTPVGTYSFAIVGNETHTSTVNLNVIVVPSPQPQPSNFTFSVAPNSVNMSSCNSPQMVTVSIQSVNDFNSPVTIMANPPSGMTISFSPNPVTPPKNGAASSQATVTVSGLMSPGNYIVPTNATSMIPQITHSTLLTIKVSGCIPGFSFESILAGIALGIIALASIKRRRMHVSEKTYV